MLLKVSRRIADLNGLDTKSSLVLLFDFAKASLFNAILARAPIYLSICKRIGEIINAYVLC